MSNKGSIVSDREIAARIRYKELQEQQHENTYQASGVEITNATESLHLNLDQEDVELMQQ